MLSVIMLSAAMLNVIMPSVMVPFKHLQKGLTLEHWGNLFHGLICKHQTWLQKDSPGQKLQLIFRIGLTKKKSFVILTPALRQTTDSKFGAVQNDFSYDNVNCIGTETSLHNCPHSNSHNCNGGEGAGVVCQQVLSS